MDRNTRTRIIYAAEALERRTKSPGARNGALGQTGLATLRCLLFRFGTRPTPSYKAVQRGTGFAVQTIADAIRRLQAAGICRVERRSTRYGRRSNAYTFAVPALILPSGREEPKERFIPFAELTGPLRDALDSLGAKIAGRGADV